MFRVGGTPVAVGAITLRQMVERMRRGESYVVLDVRGKGEFQNWQIKGLTLQAVNVPFFDFDEDEVNGRMLPARSQIVFLNAQEPAARKVADRLADKGYEVSGLVGGFFEWRNLYLQTLVVETPRLKLVQVNRVGTGCLSYVLISGHEAMVVDPSRHIEEYLLIAEREHVRITRVIDTRVHGDHISGAQALLRETSAEYFMARAALHANHLPVSLLKRGTMRAGAADVRVIVLDTEGETQGDVLFAVDERVLLCGDAVAVGEVGVPDLPGSAQEWADKLFNTVLREVKAMSDDTLVLPGHYGDIQAINAGGYVGALLGDIRLGAEAMARAKTLTFGRRLPGFVSSLPKNDETIRRINTGFESVDVEEFDLYS